MKRAAVALRRLASLVAAVVGIEGAFLFVGTALLAIGAGYFSPAGPFVVVGFICLIAGVALAVPPRRAA